MKVKMIKILLKKLGLLGFIKNLMQYKWSFFKSQKKQDKWVIFEILNLKRKGFFLDLAAADGITHSNTYALEKLFGWNGICIEPNPNFLKILKRKRKCIVVDSIVSNNNDSVEFRIDNGQLGGIIANDTDNNFKIRSNELKHATIFKKNAVTLTSILDEYGAPKIIDYFSLDVEGSEERVIQGLDFSKYTFLCITIERANENVNKILFDNGYKFVKNYKYDTFYIHESLLNNNIKLEKFEQVERKDW